MFVVRNRFNQASNTMGNTEQQVENKDLPAFASVAFI
jgi:hypothetical protein